MTNQKEESQEEIHEEEVQLLGSFLRDHRESIGASLKEVTDATRISPPVLKAIEEDDFDNMPAEAFCRGFYSMYAKFLGLDPEEIVERFYQETGSNTPLRKNQAQPPLKKIQCSKNYAEPSSVSPTTGRNILILSFIAAVIAICLYFDWNPIDYIGDKLIPPLDSPAQLQKSQEESPQGIKNEKLSEKQAASGSLQATDEELPVDHRYNLEITFHSNGVLQITTDDGFVLDQNFRAGETLQWTAEKNILLDMPETTKGILQLNGIEIPLPESENGHRKLLLPEDLLD